MTTQTNFRLEPDVMDMLDAMAAKMSPGVQLTRTQVVRIAIKRLHETYEWKNRKKRAKPRACSSN